MNQYRPSIIRLILVDYTAYSAAFLTAILWVIFFTDLLVKAYSPFFPFLILAISFVSASILLIRYRRLVALFDACIETPGVIEALIPDRGRVRINLVFTFRGERFALEQYLLRTKLIDPLKPGAQVTVLIDPDNLRQSVIKDFYIVG